MSQKMRLAQTALFPLVTTLGLWPVAASSQGFSLPDGPGKETVATICGGCHAISRLGAGYTPEGWGTVKGTHESFGLPLCRVKFTFGRIR